MVQLTASQARKELSSTLKRVRRGERVLLTNHNKMVGAIVSVADFEFLRAMEDRVDLAKARKALAEIEATGTIPWEDVKASLGL